MSTQNLWGNLADIELTRTPKVILEEQAQLLSSATGGRLRGEVDGDHKFAKRFDYSLDIVAPRLNDYRYTVLTIAHGIELYPVNVSSESVDGAFMQVECNDEQSFLLALTSALSSRTTRRVISALLSQMETSINPSGWF